MLAGRGVPEATIKAEGDAPSKASRHTAPTALGAARLAVECGRVTSTLPYLSRCKGSRVLTPEECPAFSNRLGLWITCRDWLS